MPSLLTIVATTAIAYLSTFVYCFVRNVFNARRTGFPSIIVPWDQNHFVWMLISVPLRPWLEKWLPKYVYDRIHLCIYGWEFREKLRPFEEYSGPRGNDKSYMLVTCGKSEFWTRDPEIVNQVLNRPKDFVQLDLSELFMAKFGHNVLTTNGDRWARQRKVVAGVINERISKAVFSESVYQTTGLLDELNKSAIDGVAETSRLFDMAKKITIHVLSGAGMGASVSWDDNKMERPEPGFKMTYIQAAKIVFNNMTGAVILPQWFLSNYPSFLPGHQNLNAIGDAVEEFPVHTTKMLEEERQRPRIGTGSGTRNNIMSQLLQASEQNADPDSLGGKNQKALSDEEMMGNLFIFTGAGFDTTANTVSYALVQLARHPQWQDWLLEEIDTILPADPAVQLDYVATFPKSIRVLAFMLETLRLFTPLIHISKQTRTPQILHTSQRTYWLPTNTTVFLNAVALHLDPEIWHHLNLAEGEKGDEDDVSQFRPSRWINPPGSQQPLFQPPKGTYVPWSSGPRVCPGQKMAQVEFVAIFLSLLRQHKIEAAPLAGESRADVEKRLDMRVRNSQSILTLQMNDVYDVSDSPEKGLMLRLSRRR